MSDNSLPGGASSIGVNICYRPLRIGWAIKSGDLSAFRRVAELNHTLWGGRYNAILVADRQPEAHQLVDLFGVDLILPVGRDPVVVEPAKRFEHLSDPLRGSLFLGNPASNDPINEAHAQVLNMVNALEFWTGKQHLDDLLKRGLLTEARFRALGSVSLIRVHLAMCWKTCSPWSWSSRRVKAFATSFTPGLWL